MKERAYSKDPTLICWVKKRILKNELFAEPREEVSQSVRAAIINAVAGVGYRTEMYFLTPLGTAVPGQRAGVVGLGESSPPGLHKAPILLLIFF